MTKSIALYETRNTPIPKLLLLLILLSISFAQDFSPKIKYNPKKYIAYRIDQPIIIDGKLNDSQWSNVEWTDDFVDIEGSLKPNPFFNTKVFLFLISYNIISSIPSTSELKAIKSPYCVGCPIFWFVLHRFTCFSSLMDGFGRSRTHSLD